MRKSTNEVTAGCCCSDRLLELDVLPPICIRPVLCVCAPPPPTHTHVIVVVSLTLSLLGILKLGQKRRQGGSQSSAGLEVYVSMVMCGRHDDMRGDYAGRLQNSLDFLLHQAPSYYYICLHTIYVFLYYFICVLRRCVSACGWR